MLCKSCRPVIGLFDECAVLIGRGHPRNAAPDHALPGPRWPGGLQHLSNRCRVGSATTGSAAMIPPWWGLVPGGAGHRPMPRQSVPCHLWAYSEPTPRYRLNHVCLIGFYNRAEPTVRVATDSGNGSARPRPNDRVDTSRR